MRKYIGLLAFGFVTLLIGSLIVLPINAHVTPSEDAHTLGKKHANLYALKSWTKKYAHSKGQCDKRYYTKAQTTSLLSNYYTKDETKTLFSSYYNKSDINGLLSNHYSKTDSDSRYYTQNSIDSNFYNRSDSDSRFLNSSGSDSISGTLTVGDISFNTPKTSYLSVTGADFHPVKSDGSIEYSAWATEFWHGTPGGSGGDTLLAPVHLPYGAIVTKIRYYYYDTSASNSTIYLRTHNYNSPAIYTDMASASSSGTGGYGFTDDDTISSSTIGASQYWLLLDNSGPSSDNSSSGVLIYYTYSSL